MKFSAPFFSICFILSLTLYFIIFIITYMPTGKEGCEEQNFSKCFKLSNTTSESVLFSWFASGSLDKFCDDLNIHRHCVDNFTRICLRPEERAFFYYLYGDSNHVLEEVCNEDNLRQEFTSHIRCYKELEEGIQRCTERFYNDIPSFVPLVSKNGHSRMSMRRVCYAVVRFSRCFRKLTDKCDKDSGFYVQGLFQKMSANVISVCQQKTP